MTNTERIFLLSFYVILSETKNLSYCKISEKVVTSHRF